jgi:hypothetical protein
VIAGTVILADAIASGSPTDVAVKVTCKSPAGGGGALYVVGAPLAVVVGETLPQGVVAQVTVQVTPFLLGSFTSVAVTWLVVLASTLVAAGVTLTPTEGTITVAEADFVVSVVEVPVTVILMLLAGSVVGAVYVVAVKSGVLAGMIVPQPGEHALPFCVNVQVKLPLLASLLADPLISRVVPACTSDDVGDKETVMAGTVIAVVIDFDASATDVAVRVTAKSLAGGPGAV